MWSSGAASPGRTERGHDSQGAVSRGSVTSDVTASQPHGAARPGEGRSKPTHLRAAPFLMRHLELPARVRGHDQAPLATSGPIPGRLGSACFALSAKTRCAVGAMSKAATWLSSRSAVPVSERKAWSRSLERCTWFSDGWRLHAIRLNHDIHGPDAERLCTATRCHAEPHRATPKSLTGSNPIVRSFYAPSRISYAGGWHLRRRSRILRFATCPAPHGTRYSVPDRRAEPRARMSAPMIDINPLSQFRWRRSPAATSGAPTVATLSPTPTTERQAPATPHAPDAASEMIALLAKSGRPWVSGRNHRRRGVRRRCPFGPAPRKRSRGC
jgi:hypothetical protein